MQERAESRADALQDFFGVDLRTLAFVRICVAVGLLGTLWTVASDATAFLTDEGVFPLDHWRETRKSPFHVSLYGVSGDAAWVQALLGLQAGLGVMLLLGWHTRLAGIGSFILLVSLLNRCPPMVHRGDTLLGQLLLWGMLTPWGDHWSLSRSRRLPTPHPGKLVTLATVGLVLQMPMVYFSSGLAKLRDASWTSELTAVAYAMSPEYVTALGERLVRVASMDHMRSLASLTVVLEIVAPLMIFLPILAFASAGARRRWLARLRLLAVAAATLFQTTLAVTVSIGLFPFTSIIGLAPLIPGRVWDQLALIRQRSSGAHRSACAGRFTTERTATRLSPVSWSCAAILLTNLSFANVVRIADPSRASSSLVANVQHGQSRPSADSGGALRHIRARCG